MSAPTIRIKVNEKKIGEDTVIVIKFEHVESRDREREVRILKDRDIYSLGTDLFALLEGKGHKRIIVSFANVSFLPSSMLGKLIELDRKVKEKRKESGAENSRLLLCDTCPEISEMLAMTGQGTLRLDQLFDIQKNEDAALKQFASLQSALPETL